MDAVLGGSQDRLERALQHLKDMHFLYEAAVVFDEDPLSTSKAEPQYVVHVFGAIARDSANKKCKGLGGLAREAFNCLDRTKLISKEDFRSEAFQDMARGRSAGTDLFAYAGLEKTAKLLSVYRLRYLAGDLDLAQGLKTEHRQTVEWKRRLDEAFK